MKYQVAEKGYEPSEMRPDGLKFVLDPFETREEAEAAIQAMLEQAKEDGYDDSIGNYAIVELDEGEILPPRSQILTNEAEWYAKAAGMTVDGAAAQLADAKAERERIEKLNNNEYLKQWQKESYVSKSGAANSGKK